MMDTMTCLKRRGDRSSLVFSRCVVLIKYSGYCVEWIVLLYIVFLWLYDGGDTHGHCVGHTDTNLKTSKVKRQHWICVISASGFPRVPGLILFSLLHEFTGSLT